MTKYDAGLCIVIPIVEGMPWYLKFLTLMRIKNFPTALACNAAFACHLERVSRELSEGGFLCQ
jgi:hypothetical protein